MVVKGAKLGLVRSVVAFNMVAASRLSYVASFLPPPVWVLEEYWQGLHRIANGPRFSLCKEMLVGARDLGLPMAALNLEWASLVRRLTRSY